MNIEKELKGQCKLNFPNSNELHKFTLTVSPQEGMWRGGDFYFTFEVPENYNHAPPIVHCTTKVWHPNIDNEGNVCLSLLRMSSLDLTGWAPTRTLWHVVLGLKSLFNELCDFNDPLNTEAAKHYFNDKEDFQRKVQQCIRSQKR